MNKQRRLMLFAGSVLLAFAFLAWRLFAWRDTSQTWFENNLRITVGCACLGVLLLVFRYAHVGLGLKISAEGRVFGLALALPGLVLDLERTVSGGHIVLMGVLLLALYIGQRWERHGLTGFLLAICTFFEPLFLVFLPFLVSKRRWQLLRSYAATLVFGALVYESARMVFDTWPPYYAAAEGIWFAWTDPLTVAADAGGISAQGLRVFLHRIGQWIGLRSAEVENLNPIIDSAFVGIALTTVVLLVWATRVRVPGKLQVLSAPEVGVVLLAVSLLSPAVGAGESAFLFLGAMVSYESFRRSCSVALQRQGALLACIAFALSLFALLAQGQLLPGQILVLTPLAFAEICLLLPICHPKAYPEVRQVEPVEAERVAA